jgi:hypothetical protein
VNLQTDLGKLDVLCELGEGEGYEEILAIAAAPGGGFSDPAPDGLRDVGAAHGS